MDKENTRLRQVRKHLDMDQEEFGKILGIKQGSLSDIERGKDGLGVSEHIKNILYDKLKVNKEWFENGTLPMILKSTNGELQEVVNKFHPRGDNENYWKDVAKHLEDKIRLQEELIAELKKRK